MLIAWDYMRVYLPEFHVASLSIEGKISDIYLARAAQNRWRVPRDVPIKADNGLSHDGHVIGTIGTVLQCNVD